jgi:hypothetical protein
MTAKSASSKRQTLLNYTTTVDARRTIQEIQSILATKGAQGVSVDYDPSGFPMAVTFKVIVENVPIWYRLPSKYEAAYKALCAADVPQRFKDKDQARRVCWRILKDWVEAQMAIIQLGQAQMAEAFFPYAIEHETGITLFEHWLSSRKAITAAPEHPQLEM